MQRRTNEGGQCGFDKKVETQKNEVPISKIKTVAFVTFATVDGDLNEPLIESASVLACMAVFLPPFFQT